MQGYLNEKTQALEETQKKLVAVSATVDEIQKDSVVKLQEDFIVPKMHWKIRRRLLG